MSKEKKDPVKKEGEDSFVPDQKRSQELFNQLLNGEQITKEIDLGKRGKFVVKYLLARDNLKVDQKIAQYSDGVNPDYRDATGRSNLLVYATLDVAVIDGPEGWKKAKTFLDYPDKGAAEPLYKEYLKFSIEIRRFLDDIDLSNGGTDNTGPDVQETVGDGAFSNITHGPKV
jgi:hypothetical protein